MRLVVTLAFLVGCKSDEKPTRGPAPVNDLGSCQFEVSGVERIAQTTPGWPGKVYVSDWDDHRSRADENKTITVHCLGELASVSFDAIDRSSESVPFAPKKYPLRSVGTETFMVTGTLKTARAGFVGGDGFLEITALDDSHLAGAFDFETKSWKRESGSGDAPALKTKITGTFDLRRPDNVVR